MESVATRGRPRSFDRDAALDAAMELFWERGYEGTSVGDLTRAIGIAAPSLYAAFGSKEQLFRAAVARYEQDSPTRAALAAGATAREAVAAMLHANADAYTTPGRPRGCMVVLSAPTGQPGNAELRRWLAEGRASVIDHVRARLQRGQADGDVPAGADLGTIARYFSTVLDGMSIKARDGASAEELHAVADAALAGWEALVGPA